MATNTVAVTGAGDDLLLVLDVLEVTHGAAKGHATDGIDSLPGVLQ